MPWSRAKIERDVMDFGNYRPCVGIMLLNRQGLVFIGRRKNKKMAGHIPPGHEWQMPQGGIDVGEDPYKAALRELHEETNVTSVSLLAEAPDWYSYDLPPEISKKSWKGKFDGQTQKWFAMRFEGNESEINILTPTGGHPAEFDAWRWEAMEKLVDLIIPFKRRVYERVIEAFGHLAGPC
jgi:putative (di)nucleoside polyphosphate hydrolase